VRAIGSEVQHGVQQHGIEARRLVRQRVEGSWHEAACGFLTDELARLRARRFQRARASSSTPWTS
jgi:hypothetical protein